ncbi:MAG: hypothetical protein GXY91_05160 [Clostridia bacterium]|nr:hypothetical protein [Clostridia bacterium]
MLNLLISTSPVLPKDNDLKTVRVSCYLHKENLLVLLAKAACIGAA